VHSIDARGLGVLATIGDLAGIDPIILLLCIQTIRQSQMIYLRRWQV